jgi:predicted nucleic acid-binding protein
LCLAEPASASLRRILEADPGMVVWWGSPIECWSAFARRRREGLLSGEDEDAARMILDRLHSAWVEVQPGDDVRRHAGRLLRTHSLRSLDAVQLAAALVWSGGGPGEIVVLDQRLRDAARLEGLIPIA